jgi:pimeloyl-ACP methyl ester carboxylesterase
MTEHGLLTMGDPNAPGIVFVHGTRMAGAYWHEQLISLSDSYYSVAPDLPGHGARRTDTFSYTGALEAIRDAISICSDGKAIVVGHSLGGFLVMELAASSPALCRALVLVGCSAVARGPKTWPYRFITKLLPHLSEPALTRWNNALLRRMYPARLIEPQIAAGYGFSAIAPSWNAVLGHDHALLLKTFPSPVLVLNGERDRIFRFNEDYFVRSCAHGEIKIITGAGHLCNLDRPAEFTASVRLFADAVIYNKLAF